MSEKKYKDKQLKGEAEEKESDKKKAEKDTGGKSKDEIQKVLEKKNVYHDARWSKEKLRERLEKFEKGYLKEFRFGYKGEYENLSAYGENHSEAVKVFEDKKKKID